MLCMYYNENFNLIKFIKVHKNNTEKWNVRKKIMEAIKKRFVKKRKNNNPIHWFYRKYLQLHVNEDLTNKNICLVGKSRELQIYGFKFMWY